MALYLNWLFSIPHRIASEKAENKPFLTSAASTSFIRYFCDFSFTSSGGCENLVKAVDGGGKGSCGWAARNRTAESIRCNTGEKKSSNWKVSIGSLFCVSWGQLLNA